MKQFAPPVVWNFLHKLNSSLFNKDAIKPCRQDANDEETRINTLGRYTETEVNFLGRSFKIVDNASYHAIKKEWFDDDGYRFTSDKECPFIIDCGANIGLSVIYYKQLFPKAEIIAFEPDDKVFSALKYNVESFQFSNVTLLKKACWDEETTLKFKREGADAGRIAGAAELKDIVEVETVRLRDYLTKPVDFLKVDIEGAELNVLRDCSDRLSMVEKMFVEYHSFLRREQQLPELLQIIQNAGFRFHIAAPHFISTQPFIKRVSYLEMDNQVNIFCFR